jgi:caa(3)-type oxidase subunit IV
MTHDAAEIERHVRAYVIVFAALIVLTGATVGVYYLHLPVWPAIGVALVIATVKATLVGCFFMHLISEKSLIFAVLVLTVVFFAALLLLPTLTSDLNQVRT